ncbi:hypothetical protein A0J61_03839 [Choanephora cucurbitarum]|uniref:CAP-Gly domain-containing protein n=1 Tax=Choanephora cucurbitarum TaxID=101091 RepID=A0A1C7NGG9_9FUNG|nr:hypothetical protein A0J61_03839 [Choanephora cucurbitarum]
MPLFSLKKKFSPHSFSSLGLRKTQSTGDIDDGALTPLSSSSVSLHPQRIVIVNHKSTDTIVSILRSPDQPPLSPPISETPDDHRELATKLREITACDMDLLLSLETQARMDVQEKKQRASHVRFELPITPPTHSPDSEQQQFIYARQRRWSLPEDGTEDMLKKDSFTLTRLSRWSRLMKQQQQEEARHNQLLLGQSNSSLEELSDNDNADSVTQTNPSSITIGSKVKLFKRPLPLIGKVQFIGHVHWDQEHEWLGIELDGRVGNTDGKIDHIRSSL